MLADELSITITGRASAGSVRITVAGDIDVSNAAWLSRALDAAAEHTVAVELDLAAVTFFSCEGLHVLSHARDVVGDAFTVVAASQSVRRVLELVDLHREFGLGDKSPG